MSRDDVLPPGPDDDHAWLDDGFMTTVEASGHLHGVIPLDIRRWCHQGLVRYVKEETSRWYLVSAADIRSLADFCGARTARIELVRVWADQHSASKSRTR